MEAPRTLDRLATHASDWAGFAGRLETIKALLHVVAVLSFNNKALILLTQPVVARIRNVTADGDALPEDEMPDVKEADHPKNSSLSLLIKMQPKSSSLRVVAKEIALVVARCVYRPDIAEHIPGVTNTVADTLSRSAELGKRFRVPLSLHGAEYHHSAVRHIKWWKTRRADANAA